NTKQRTVHIAVILALEIITLESFESAFAGTIDSRNTSVEWRMAFAPAGLNRDIVSPTQQCGNYNGQLSQRHAGPLLRPTTRRRSASMLDQPTNHDDRRPRGQCRSARGRDLHAIHISKLTWQCARLSRRGIA